ncbi:MAG: pitrilysin family protein, partial [Rubrivivax sp.]
YFLERDQVKRVTLADINRVAGQYLKPDNRTVAVYLPVAKPQRAPAPAKVDVAALVKDYKGDPNVALAEPFEATPANLDRRSETAALASGLKVALIPKGTRGRAVQARLVLRFGDVESLKGRSTAAEALGSMFKMGGAGLTRQQLADRLDALRTDLAISASGQTVQLSFSTVREHLPAAIELIGKLLREPALPPAGLEEVRRQWLASIEEQRREPEAVVANTLARHGNPYPKGDPRYAETFEELEQSVKALTVAQLRDFHRRFYSAAHGEFAAVGDQDSAAVKRALATAFGTWRAPAAGPQRYERVPRPAVAVPAQRYMLATPDKQNATLGSRLTLRLNDSSADYPLVLLANHIVGGGGSSRLWKRIRETEGLSYDVRSSVSWNAFEANSTWTSSAIFAPQNQSKVERAWRAELARSVAEGFTQAELDEAKASLANFRRLSRAQDEVVAGQAASNLFLGRTFAFAQRVDEQIAAATLEQVNAAWKRQFDPAQIAEAWGGDFKATP